ncbi:MAG: hypothetical protein JO197_06145 [Acidobacteria bacterium]|nr:hypothetical protein [Acidobacteriota bacterium]MBV9070640.1 hypothetical protein [Acidobacteriota bacterium]MBV9478173.1 hypothetical protein [Acidobacteriota bacterium]
MAQDNPTNNWNSASDTGASKPGGTSGLGTTGTSGSMGGGTNAGGGSLANSSSGSTSGGSSFGSGSSGLGTNSSSSGAGLGTSSSGGASGGFGTSSGTSGLGGGSSTGTGVSSGGALGTQNNTDSGLCPHCGQALKGSGGLEQFLGRLGITEDMIGNLKGQFQNVDIDEYLNTARDYLKDGSTRATSYAKDNPGKVAAGVAALALGAGLIYAAVNRDKD